jgi:hypothetical protein
MNKRCKHVEQNGFNCGSYAFNLYKDDINQGDLCDVHYWQEKAQRTWVGLEKSDMPDGPDPMYDHGYFIAGMVFANQVLKEKNT